MSNVDWILITLVRAISRVRANNATPPPPFPPLQPSPPSDQAFCACFASRQKRNIIREGGNFERKKSERGKKKKKNPIYPYFTSLRNRITNNYE